MDFFGYARQAGLSALFAMASMGAIAAPSDLPSGLKLPIHHEFGATTAARPFIRYLRPSAGETPVTMVTDRGPISEITVMCGDRRDGIISYSKIERLYCDSHLRCGSNFDAAVAQTCGQR